MSSRIEQPPYPAPRTSAEAEDPGAYERLTAPDPTQRARHTAQLADTPDRSTDTSPVIEAQRGAVGASFLRLRPWIVALPAMATLLVFHLSGAPPSRGYPLTVVMGSMLGFFVYEAWSLSRRGVAFVTAQRLGISMLVTVTGLSMACGLTGGWRSPMLPLLLAPLGVTFAAFGRRGWSWGVALYLGVHLLGIALAGWWAPWSFPMPIGGVVGVVVVVVTGALLWAGVAALTDAHRRAARDLERMRRAVVDEAARRQRELEGMGAKVAHEVKNPLTAVKTVVQLAARQTQEPKHMRRFEVAAAEVARIESILEGYLSMARPLDDLRLAPVSARVLVEHVAVALEGKEVEVRWHAPDVEVVVDRQRVTEALLNLALNAIAASDEGAVTLSAEVDHRLRIIVRDEGIGMSPELLARATTAYVTTKPDGTGLGLALAQTTARQHGGELRLESREGEGTTATLDLPRYPGSPNDGDDSGRR